jgi:O-antigen/teichoic acid export membrane protein
VPIAIACGIARRQTEEGVDITLDCLHIHAVKLWRSGIIISALGFIAGLGNYWFQSIISHRLTRSGEFGLVGNTLYLVELLSLPLAIVSTSLVHYIAHYRAHDDTARLQGLISGYQRFLLRATIVGTLIAIVAAQPIGKFFEIRTTLAMAAIGVILVAMWAGYALALCQGMAWFKRVAIIGLFGVALRLAFGWAMTTKYPTAEVGVLATAFSLLANLALLYWRKDIFKKGAEQVSPWDRHFVKFLVIATSILGGTFLFTKGDSLVANRYFDKTAIDYYMAAGLLGRSLVLVVGPLLTVVFTSRSGKQNTQALGDQKILLGLYAVGLAGGAAVLYLLRGKLLVLFGKSTPEAADMVTRVTISMVAVGLTQAIGIWSLASRWYGLSMLYGALGLAYWLTLLIRGKTPADLLATMPIAAGVTFALLCFAWLLQLKRDQSRQPA